MSENEHYHCAGCCHAFVTRNDARRCCETRKQYKCLVDCLPVHVLQRDADDDEDDDSSGSYTTVAGD